PAAGLGTAGWVLGSAHKFGGARGSGFVVAPADGIAGFHGFTGGSQENDHRAGTEDLPGIRALVAALADCEQHEMHLESARLLWRAAFERAIAITLPGSGTPSRSSRLATKTPAGSPGSTSLAFKFPPAPPAPPARTAPRTCSPRSASIRWRRGAWCASVPAARPPPPTGKNWPRPSPTSPPHSMPRLRRR